VTGKEILGEDRGVEGADESKRVGIADGREVSGGLGVMTGLDIFGGRVFFFLDECRGGRRTAEGINGAVAWVGNIAGDGNASEAVV
jgi:hypothetical protein